MRDRLILSLCDYTGAWAQPYRESGYAVRQVDLKHGDDVRLLPYLDRPVHGILAAPPCTAFAGSGARWWPEKDATGAHLEGLAVVDACLRAVALYRPVWWALENPVGRLARWLGPPAFRFDPCDYGDPYTKRTCLWGRFTPPLPLFVGEDRAVVPTEGSRMWQAYGGRSERTKTLRSVTPTGFARAFFAANP